MDEQKQVQHGRLDSSFSSYILQISEAYLKISQKYLNLIFYFENLECCILRCDAIWPSGNICIFRGKNCHCFQVWITLVRGLKLHFFPECTAAKFVGKYSTLRVLALGFLCNNYVFDSGFTRVIWPKFTRTFYTATDIQNINHYFTETTWYRRQAKPIFSGESFLRIIVFIWGRKQVVREK